MAGSAGANSGPNSGSVSGSDSASFCQAGRAGEEVVAGLRLGAGANGLLLVLHGARGPWATGGGSAGSGDGAATTADTTLVTTRLMDGQLDTHRSRTQFFHFTAVPASRIEY